MMRALQTYVCLSLCMLGYTPPTRAVMSNNYVPPPATPTQADYAAGIAAFNEADWQGVIDHMTHVVAQRPWHDDAYNMLGYAYRKLGNYRRALASYHQALELNPYHRGALEYLGEAYVEMGCLTQAHATLGRLHTACLRISRDGSADTWKAHCREWQELSAVIDAARASPERECIP